MKFIGLDIGTTSICGLVIDAATGDILELQKQKNATAIISENAWERIQNPSAILEITESILNSLLSFHTDIKGLALTGQMHGIVYVDAQGNAVSPLYTWEDGRGNLPSRDGKTYAEELAEQTGYPVSSGMGCVTHYYHLQNNMVPDGATGICTIQDYVSMKLAGRTATAIDTTDAASLGCFDLEALCFDKPALAKAGFDNSILPKIVSGCEELGKTKEGISVYPALGDNHASFLGAVKNINHSVLVNVGTGSQVSAYLDEYVEAPGLEIRPFPTGGYLYVGASLCGGSSFALLKEFFSNVMVLFTGQSADTIYDIMEAVPFDSAPAEDLPGVDPRFDGSRLNPGVRGSIGNIGTKNFTPENLVLSFQDGMARELYEFYAMFPEPLKQRVQLLVGSGNGLRKNKTLRRFLEKHFKHPVHIPPHREAAAYGAALLAAHGGGCFQHIKKAGQLVPHETEG